LRNVLLACLLALLALSLLYFLTSCSVKVKASSHAPVPYIMWRFFWLPIMIQGLIVLATILSILILVRERILR